MTEDVLSSELAEVNNEDEKKDEKVALLEMYKKFIRFCDEQKQQMEQEGGFWESKAGRRIVDGAVFFAGYLFSDKRIGIQSMDAEKYSEFADALRGIFQKIGLEPDTNFFRWQMSDFFGIAYWTYFWRHTLVRYAIGQIQEKGLFGRDKQWYEKNASLISAFGVGTTLGAYEILQGVLKSRSLDVGDMISCIDVKDMIAYIAGIGLFLGSEKIFQEYLKLKNDFKGKVAPFFKKRLPVIKQQFEVPASRLSEMMDNVIVET